MTIIVRSFEKILTHKNDTLLTVLWVLCVFHCEMDRLSGQMCDSQNSTVPSDVAVRSSDDQPWPGFRDEIWIKTEMLKRQIEVSCIKTSVCQHAGFLRIMTQKWKATAKGVKGCINKDIKTFYIKKLSKTKTSNKNKEKKGVTKYKRVLKLNSKLR